MKTTERLYEVRGGGKYPSVTTIESVIGKPALVPWAAKQERTMVMEAAANLHKVMREQGLFSDEVSFLAALEGFVGKTKAADKKLKEAGEIGSSIHELIEWETRRRMGQGVGVRPKAPEEAEAAFLKWVKWADDSQAKFVFLEQAVWNEKVGYAGRMDATAEVKWPDQDAPIYTLIDYKSGKAIYPEAILQVSAYREAIRSMGHRIPDRAIIIRVPKQKTDPEVETREVLTDELDAAFVTFRAVFHLYRWMKQHENPKWAPKQDVVKA